MLRATFFAEGVFSISQMYFNLFPPPNLTLKLFKPFQIDNLLSDDHFKLKIFIYNFFFQNSDGNFIMSFTYRVQDPKTSMAYFAFCFPWAYSECQDQLDALDEKFRYCAQLNAKR